MVFLCLRLRGPVLYMRWVERKCCVLPRVLIFLREVAQHPSAQDSTHDLPQRRKVGTGIWNLDLASSQ